MSRKYDARPSGCIATGRTIEETKRNMTEAIKAHLQFIRETGDPIPEPTAVVADSPARSPSRASRATICTPRRGSPFSIPSTPMGRSHES